MNARLLFAGLLAVAAVHAPAARAAGHLDPGFGTDGVVLLTLDDPPNPAARDVLIDGIVDSQGRPVAVGYRLAPDFGPATSFVVRRLPDGRPDPTFAERGVFRLEAGGVDRELVLSSVIQVDAGKLLLGGSVRYFADEGYFPILCRLDAAGALDPSFGNAALGIGGCGLYGEQNQYSAGVGGLAVSSTEGKFVALLGTGTLGRFSPDGVPDPCFNTFFCDGDGTLTLAEGTVSRQLFVDNEHRVVVVGQHDGPGFKRIIVERLLPQLGARDQAFGDGGRVEVDFEEVFGTAQKIDVGAARVLPDGSIVLAGTIGTNDRVLAIAKLKPDGSYDKQFGLTQTGVTLDVFDDVSKYHYARSIELQHNGRLLIGGYTAVEEDPNKKRCAMLRRHANGQRDMAFGQLPGASISVGDLLGPGTSCQMEKVQADGRRIIAFGTARAGGRLQPILLGFDQDIVFKDDFSGGVD